MGHAQSALTRHGLDCPSRCQMTRILAEIRPEQFHRALSADEGFIVLDPLLPEHFEHQHKQFVEQDGDLGMVAALPVGFHGF